MLSVLSSPGVLFQGNVHWEVQASQVVPSELTRANDILSDERGQVMFNEEHCQILSNVGEVTYTVVVSVARADGTVVQDSSWLNYRFDGGTWDAFCSDI